MILSAIAAVGKGNVIGIGNQLPWHLASDLKHFKEVTMGKSVIMGQMTHESIGTILPGRTNIVISDDPSYHPQPGAVLVRSLDEAIAKAKETGAEEAFLIGGAYTYMLGIPHCERLYLTRVDAELPEGDKYFPDINIDEWNLVSKEDGVKTENDDYHFAFEVYERKHAN